MVFAKCDSFWIRDSNDNKIMPKSLLGWIVVAVDFIVVLIFLHFINGL